MADTKYFSEHPEWIHLDARFVPQGFEFNHTILHETLGVVLRSFSSFCLENEIPYWLAHGTLIGWYWGQKMLPWDGDVDLQTSMKGLSILAKFNQTLIQDRFLIDVNPNYVDRRGRRRTMDDTWTNNNKIDARVIDTHTGIFADITGLSLDRRHGGDDYNLKCKDGHHYRFQSLSPLHQTTVHCIRAHEN
ncbi:LicD family-domain-containing protein [Gorgonomyces haynaldii]|nr:LicD family-domain-containing protein [Gorgonomyces haynaldii]